MRAGRHTIYRGAEPQRKPLIWLAAGLVGLCLGGLYIRGPEPVILAALAISPLAVLAYFLFVIWGQQRIRRVDLDTDALVLSAGLRNEWRVPLAALGEWTLKDITLYSIGVSYDAGEAVQTETGSEVKGPALTTLETATGRRIELVLEDAQIDIDAFRAFAPRAIADLERRAARKGRTRIRFTPISAGR